MKQQSPLYLVDDDEAVLDSLGFMLRQFGFVLTPFVSGIDFLNTVDLTQAGCVILDSRMPEITGQALQQRLLDANSPLGIIFLTGHGDLPMAVCAFRKGACDFFQKPVSGQALAEAINKSMTHSQQHYETLQLKQNLAKLTEREHQVLELLVQGKTNKQISEALFLSLRTIEVHRSNVMKKLKVHNMAELAKYSQI
ncbi:LuxR C-terminal-related transcriptional regulator [Shewanella mesophila]|uniref:response regulator transcription factor n=1 Tax=Shewanella mesophila TaxID=2864208 RepID=UPI001C65F0E9|nr:LuxR C-terminal-related transcriptional regulator [Shewanella mesophila]QYJ86671.1 LuxR C-terminal-related transcriptional regulator [Shewanella mesophila]